MNIFEPTSFESNTHADDLHKKEADSAAGVERSSGIVANTLADTMDEFSSVKLAFDRRFGPLRVNDWLSLDVSDLIALGNAIEQARTLAGSDFKINGSGGDRFMRGNNVVLKDWPDTHLLKNGRYRLTDAFGMTWNGPLRTLGVLTHVKKRHLVGYVISRSPELRIPDLEKTLTYPLGSASVRLNKTHQDLRTIHKMMPVYSDYEVALDVSVSSMIESEGKFLRNVISPHQFSYDVLTVHKLANELRGDFLASAIEAHNDIYKWGVTEFCVQNARFGVTDLNYATKLLPSLVGSYNHASMGVKYQFLASKALPDPIKVGNLGDVNGNMGAPEPDFDLSNFVGDLYNGALGFLQTMYASPTVGQIGLAKNDGKAATGPGWVSPPAPDGGMAWNTSHLQAAYHLEGELISPPAVDWFNEVRLIVVSNEVSNLLDSAGSAGSGKLQLVHDFGENYVFIPAISYRSGYGQYIHQNGSVVNLLVDRFNPEVDDGS